MKTSIAYLTLYTEMGGGEYGLFHLVKNLDRERFTPIVVAPEEGPLVTRLRELGIEVVLIPFRVVMLQNVLGPRAIRANCRAALALRRLFVERKVKAVQCGDVLALLLLIPVVATLRIRVIYNLIFFYEWARMLLFNVLAFFTVDRIVCLSRMIEVDMLEKTWGLAGKSTIIYWGVDTERFHPRSPDERTRLRVALGLPVDKKIVGFIGRYDVWKGHLVFLEAARQVAALRDDVLFLMVGGAMTENLYPAVRTYRERVLRWVEENPMGDKLVVWGHRDDVPEIMAALDVFVCPSDYEPFGLVVLEALACDVPTVVSSTVGAVEVTSTMEKLFVAEHNNIDQFGERIQAAIYSGSVRSVGIPGKDFSWDRTSVRYAQLLNV